MGGSQFPESRGDLVNVKAVIFDYFGTLTLASGASTRRAGAERVAAALGVDPSVYFEAVTSTFTERSTVGGRGKHASNHGLVG